MALAASADTPVDRALAAGDKAFEAGDLPLAQKAYEEARALSPRAAPPMVGLARVRIAKVDLPMDYAAGKGNAEIVAAHAALKRAVAVDPAFAPGQLELGRAALLLGDAEAAMSTLRRAVALAPAEAEAHSVLGVALLATGHADEALVELAKAASIDPGSAARHSNVGTAYFMNGRVPEATREYEAAVRLADTDARAHSELGAALLAGNDGVRAISELRRAIELDPARAAFRLEPGIRAAALGGYPRRHRRVPARAFARPAPRQRMDQPRDGALEGREDSRRGARRPPRGEKDRPDGPAREAKPRGARRRRAWHSRSMNQPPPRPEGPPRDPDEVMRQQARLEQMMLESRLEIVRSHREQRESRVNRRFTFILCFALSGFVAFILDKKGFSPEQSFVGCVVTFVVIAAWWTYRKPYG